MYLDRADVINSDFFLGLSKNQIAALGKAGMQDVELHSASLAFLYVGGTPKSLLLIESTLSFMVFVCMVDTFMVFSRDLTKGSSHHFKVSHVMIFYHVHL